MPEQHRAEQPFHQPDAARPPPSGEGHAVFLLDPQGAVAGWNLGAERLLGYREEEVIGRPVSSFYTPKDSQGGGPEQELRTAASQGRAGGERGCVRKDGHHFRAAVSIEPVRDGGLKGFVTVLRDLTRKRPGPDEQESEARQAAVLNAALDAIITIDHEGKVVEFNPAAERTFGYRRGQVLGREMAELLVPAHLREAHRTGLTHYLATGDGPVLDRRVELTALRADGTEFPVELSITRVDAGGPPLFTGCLRDITERRRQEAATGELVRLAALEKAVGLALTAADSTREMLQRCAEAVVRQLGAAFARVWTLNDAGDVLELQASAGVYTHLDGPHGRVPVGRYKIGLIAQEKKPHLTNEVIGDPRVSDQDWARREGMVAFAGYPLLVEGRLTGVVAMFARRPLSGATLDAMASVANGIALGVQRKQAEGRLREETRIAETLNRLGGTLAADLDLHTLVQTVTDEATALTHAEFGAFFHNVLSDQGEAFTLHTLSGVPPEAFGRLPMPADPALFDPVLRGQGVVRVDDVNEDPRGDKSAPHQGTPDGQQPVRSCLAVPVVSRSGEVLGGLFFGHSRPGVFTERDERLAVGIAGQAAVAMDNARLYEQARSVGEQLRRRNEELAAASRQKDDFLAMLAHELRNPLAPIRNGLHILKQAGADREAVDRAWEMMDRQAGHMTRIIDDLLEVSRLTRGLITPHAERLDLARLVRLAAEDHRPAFARAGVTLAVEVPEVPVWVHGDRTRLTQVMANLLENAAKFTDRGGRVDIRVEVEPAGGQAVATVRDTGVGIEPGLLPRLFTPLTQPDASLHRSGGGLGLGLALVKGLVELHGGQVRAASAGPGRGAEFTVELPVRPEPAAVANTHAAPRRAGRRLRVLVVEDNPDAAESLRMLLRLVGHEVTVASTGPAGVREAKRWTPDVVLCDIGLPGLDGYGVVGELRRDPTTAAARVFALTGYGSEEDRRRSKEAGFDRHLVKPVDLETLQGCLTDAPPHADAEGDDAAGHDARTDDTGRGGDPPE